MAAGTFREERGTPGALVGIGATTAFDRDFGAGAEADAGVDGGFWGGRTVDALVGSSFFTAGLILRVEVELGAFADGFTGSVGTFLVDDGTGAVGAGTALASLELAAVAVVPADVAFGSGFLGVAGEAWAAAAGTRAGGTWDFGGTGVERRTGFIVFD